MIFVLAGILISIQGVWLIMRPKRLLASLVRGDEKSYKPEILFDPRAHWTIRIIGAGFIFLGVSLIVSNAG